MKKLPSYTVHISNNVAELLEDPRPVVALNVMGFWLLTCSFFKPKDFVFWADGVFGVIGAFVSGVTIAKKPGRDLLSELMSCIKMVDRQNLRVLILGADADYPIMRSCLAGRLQVVSLDHYRDLSQVLSSELPSVDSADLVLIGIASPKQEALAARVFAAKKVKIFCLGGAFGMFEKQESTCPRWISLCGLEWLFRMHSEPKRRVKRLASTLPGALVGFLTVLVRHSIKRL